MTWRSSEDLKNEVRDVAGRFLRGLVRRFAVTLTDGTLWRVLGQRGGTGGDETRDLETFPGIGIYARPSSGGKPEVIALAVGGAKHQVIVASRDEAARQAALADDIQPGETCVYNGLARLVLKADNTVEIRLHGGVAVELALKSDVVAVDNKYAAHIHLTSSGGTDGPLATVIPNVPNPAYPTTDPVNPYLDPLGTPTTNPDHAGAGLADAGIVGTTCLKSH